MSTRRGNGEGSVHQLSDGRWRAQIDLGRVGGKRLRPTRIRDTKKEALVALDELKRATGRGIRPEQTSTGQWLRYWLEDVRGPELKPFTRRGFETYLRVWILPAVGNIPLQKLEASHVRAMIRHMQREGKAPATVRQAVSILKAALNVAVQDRHLEHNPAAITVRVPSNPHPILTWEQAQQVIAATETLAERARVVVALMTGLRQSEALGLRWSDIDLGKRAHIRIDTELIRVGGEWMRVGVKSAKSHRSVLLVPAAAELLRLWKAEQGGDGDDLVFPGVDGGPRHSRTDLTAWQRVCERAGVPVVPLHGARGTAATYLLQSGAPLMEVAGMLGHADAAVTLKHYARAMEGAHDKMMMEAFGGWALELAD